MAKFYHEVYNLYYLGIQFVYGYQFVSILCTNHLIPFHKSIFCGISTKYFFIFALFYHFIG